MNPREARISEDAVSAIDYMSRLIGAIEDGNWYYAADKLGQLNRTLTRLEVELDRKDLSAAGPPVAAYVAEHSQRCRLGRALYGQPTVTCTHDQPSVSETCGDCGCCTEGACGGPNPECPTNYLGDSTCPCTCD
ncbi:hypothetical protein ACIBG7_43040 [Nonomuraea sp. NPDC050328]|uniref:hypothetical protein n=1 Tax=Nonomuraea sp. NPDC050328 TaxID=3364361 RepID=UPI00378B161E